MAKYNPQFKLEVVQQYLDGSVGFTTVANRHGLDTTMVRRWVEYLRAQGQEGLDKKLTDYSPQFKLSVLQPLWDNQLSYLEVVTLFNIRNPSILASWERTYDGGGIAALKSRPRGRPKNMADPNRPKPAIDDERRTREELLAELNQLRMENAYLKKLEALVQAQKRASPKKRK